MVCEEDMQEGSINASVHHLSPKPRRKLKSRASVTFADLPTEPSSKTKDNAPTSFPMQHRLSPEVEASPTTRET